MNWQFNSKCWTVQQQMSLAVIGCRDHCGDIERCLVNSGVYCDALSLSVDTGVYQSLGPSLQGHSLEPIQWYTPQDGQGFPTKEKQRKTPFNIVIAKASLMIQVLRWSITAINKCLIWVFGGVWYLRAKILTFPLQGTFILRQLRKESSSGLGYKFYERDTMS